MDFSFAEFAIIGIVALLVIGPDKLPGLAKTAGLWVGKVRGFINSVKTEIDAELKMEDIKKAVKGGNNSLHEISEIIKDTRSQFQNSINPNASIKDAIDAPSEYGEEQSNSDTKQDYLVKAIPDDFDEEDDGAHHDVEDDFIDDYESDFEIEEIEPAKPVPVKKAKVKTKAKKKAAKKAVTPAKKKTKKKTSKKENS